MAQFWRFSYLLPVLFLSPFSLKMAHAQVSSLDALQRELDELKTKQKGLIDNAFSTFLTEMDKDAVDGEAALAFLDSAKETIAQDKANAEKPPTPDDGSGSSIDQAVQSQPTERKHHHSQNQNTTNQPDPMVAAAHCGLVRFAALYILHPDTANLDTQWKTWLESAGENYPSLKREDPLFQTPVSDSVIPKFYKMDLSGKEQSDWKVAKLSDIYEKYILKPLGDANDPKVLAAWDTFAGMKKVDVDALTFSTDVEPTLYFNKEVADYKLNPTVDKISKLYQLAEQNPAHKDFSKWLDTISGLIADMRARYGVPAPATTTTTTATH
jgi:hypothetical protein